MCPHDAVRPGTVNTAEEGAALELKFTATMGHRVDSVLIREDLRGRFGRDRDLDLGVVVPGAHRLADLLRREEELAAQEVQVPLAVADLSQPVLGRIEEKILGS